MNRNFVKRVGLALLAVASIGLVATSRSEARPSRPRPRGFQLFAGSTVEYQPNRVWCGIRNIGETCVNVTGSPVVGGGYWPTFESGDQYIFNSGLQIAGIISDTGFAWSGDTVGTWFMDPRGDQQSGEGITDIFSSTDDDDLANWPGPAFIRDTALYATALQGRQAISQGDIWLRYWDGNPNQTTGRPHPAGIMVEQRGLAWGYPSGNEDLLYFIYRFINVTARNRAVYDGLSVAGYTPGQIDTIAAVGARFQDLNEAKFNVAIPDSGYSIASTYAAFFMDPDVGTVVSDNYSTAILPFAIGTAYIGPFRAPTWQFPSNIFSPPFAAAPGFVGVKYLKSPINPATGREFGITIWSNTTNGAPFPDAQGIEQVYRYLSGTVSPALGDNSCTVTNPQARHSCASVQTQADTRFFESSGPFNLAPGQSAVIVVAYEFAAPVAAAIAPYIGGDLKPSIPPTGDRLVNGLDTVRTIDRAAGWISATDRNADGSITQDEVLVVQRSLLGKALVAQAVYDNKFLLPFSPETPDFSLVPGDHQVTIVWGPSASETVPDAYFNVAKDSLVPDPLNPGQFLVNALYDPNYRPLDVEGYRVWRGRTASSMQVIAQFDYANTTFPDNNGSLYNTDYGSQCAPELGLTTSCPAFPHQVPIATQTGLQPGLVQVAPGGRVVTASIPPAVVITSADTAVSGGLRFPPLTDNGVPFVFVDTTALNGVSYVYAVTTFDINSVKSMGVGNTSLESPLETQRATPRASGSNVSQTAFVTGVFGGDGTQLNPADPFPLMDANNGTLNGPIPPTNAAEMGFLAAVSEALPTGDFVARIDSVGIGLGATFGTDPTVYVSFIAGPDTFPATFPSNTPTFNAAVTTRGNFSASLPLVPYDTAQARLVGIPADIAATGRMPVLFQGQSVPLAATGTGIGVANGRYGADGTTPAARYFAYPYWWDGTTQPPDPTIDPFPSADHTNGKLPGVTNIWMPVAYRLPLSGTYGINAFLRSFQAAALVSWYAADLSVTWGAGGTVTVRDSTHRTTLPFKPGVQPGYGFLSLANVTAAGVTAGDLADGTGSPSLNAVSYHHLYSVEAVCSQYWGINCAPLSQTATIQPLDYTGDGVADGNGIVMVINGMPFFLEMAALPAPGTTWYLRSYGGGGMTASCALPTSPANVPSDCTNYVYTVPTTRPAWVPGVKFGIRVTQQFVVNNASGNLNNIHTVPDPYYVTHSLEATATSKSLRFVNLPNQAIVRIYSLSGVLVNVLSHNDPAGGGELVWNLRNRNNQFIASGVYFYHVETPDGREKVGRFTVVNYAQ